MIILNGEPIQVGHFPNHERWIKLPEIKATSNRVVLYYYSDQDLMDLMFLQSHINDACAGVSVELIIAYMPYSRMDRANKDYVFSLKYVCQMINWLYFAKVRVVEPHSDVTLALLERAKPIWIVEKMVYSVMNTIGFKADEDYLVFPDGGAQKRYSELAKLFKHLVGFKSRDFATGDIVSLSLVCPDPEHSDGADYKDAKALIVDDLCSKGSTFVDVAGELHHLGFAEKHLLVAHCEENIYYGDVFECIDSVHATTSLHEESVEEKLSLYNLQMLVEDLIEEMED